MSYFRKGPAFAAVILLVFIDTSFPRLTSGQPSSGQSIRHHDLFVQIDPDRHALMVVDRMTIDLPRAQRAIRLSLAPTLQLDRLVLSNPDGSADEGSHDLPFEVEHDAASSSAQHITVPAAVVTAGTMILTAYYHGSINDPPKEPRHLRFVTPSETGGHIGSEGVYLSSESQWYPDLPESLSTYRLRMGLPSGWMAVTQGKPRTSGPCPTEFCPQPGLILMEWDLTQPSEALTIVANRFVSKARQWTASTGQPVQLATYLFPEDAHLADEYLDATARYLEAYIPLLGPYPFETFAVVENFFASGLGMPSFTLLGSGVIKRHYVQPYALGHEIVHSWIGNTVFNRVDRGNWVEGLTTYLANYYWHELTGDQVQARDQRRLMLRGYNLHVPPGRDYPVGQFTHKQDERDNAIGYQKTAMVFHLLRQEIGDGPFWRSLKNLVVQYRGRHADWHDVERVFAEGAGKDLRWFFRQWVEESGAPELTLKKMTTHPITGDSNRAFQLTGSVIQTGKVFRSPLPLRITMEDGREQTVQTQVKAAEDLLTVNLPARPMTIELDPDAMIMRRIPRQFLPPVLNHYVTDRRRSVVLAFPDSPDGSHPFHDIVKRIEAQESQRPQDERSAIIPLAHDALFPQEGSVLVLGSPESRTALQSLMNMHCGARLQLDDDGVTLAGTAYDGAGIAVLASCHRQNRPGSVVTWLYAVTPQAATTVARLLFFYGWTSYVVFNEGKAVARGEWETGQERMEVSLDDSALVR